MRHVDGRHTLRLQPLDQLKQVLGFQLRQAARRLVENQDPRAVRHRRGDLDELLLADGQFADQPGRIDLRLDRAEIFLGPTQHFAAGYECRARRQLTEAEFSATVRFSQNASSWCTMPMPAAIASLGFVNRTGLSIDDQFAFVGRVDAGQNLPERAFARAVLAAERVARATRHIKAHVPQRLHAGKAFADSLELDEGSLAL